MRTHKPVKAVTEPENLFYFLRTCAADGTSRYGSFKWNLEIGAVNIAPDWNDKAECGGGLHGLLGGQGESTYLDWREDAIWVVFSSPTYISLRDKHKVQEATICAVGDRKTVTDFLVFRGFQGVHGSIINSGDRTVSSVGDRGKVRVGVGGHAFAGISGIANAGDYGYAYACDYGHACVGKGGTAIASYKGTVCGGDKSELILKYWGDGRTRSVTEYVGENGIKANTVYMLNSYHQFEEVIID